MYMFSFCNLFLVKYLIKRIFEEADGADGKHEGDPEEGENELAAPLDLHGLGGDGQEGGDEQAGLRSQVGIADGL